MNNGKSFDFNGISVELLKYGSNRIATDVRSNITKQRINLKIFLPFQKQNFGKFFYNQ